MTERCRVCGIVSNDLSDGFCRDLWACDDMQREIVADAQARRLLPAQDGFYWWRYRVQRGAEFVWQRWQVVEVRDRSYDDDSPPRFCMRVCGYDDEDELFKVMDSGEFASVDPIAMPGEVKL